MINFLAVLATILSLIASGLLFLVFLLNICCRIRCKFPISVNCWFCNSWTKVHYDERNSFDCPTCLQYNGFTQDGGYNKIIPEQHDELMNKSTRIKNRKTVASNGLCVLCNNNQQLKIIQLANFVPLVEENYDVEIEHFQEQLEKAYKLCRKCDKVLNKTIDKQTAWIFGNRLKTMCSNGFSSAQKMSSRILNRKSLSLLSKFNGTLSIILVISLLLIILSYVKYVTKTLSKYLPVAYLPVFKDLILLSNPTKPFKVNLPAPYTLYDLKIDPFVFVCCSGLFIQVIGSFGKYLTTEKINRLLCWTILLLTSRVHFHKTYASYILVLQICSCVYLLCTSFNKAEGDNHTKTSNRFMKKVVKSLEHTCSMTDFSDTSDIEEVSSSSKKTSTTQDSLDYLNRSTCSVHSNLQNYVPAKNYTFNTANNVLNYNYTELNKSLNNLHLKGLNFGSSKYSFSVVSLPVKRPKPVLSPPKLQSVNSWVAGGFWRNEDGIILPVAQRTNLSRSSSESSGFGSQHDNGDFIPLKNNFQSDFDKFSMHSEFIRPIPSPNHVFSPIKPYHRNNMASQGGFGRPPSFSFSEPISKYNEPYQRNNLFQNWSDKINAQATQSFRDLRLHSNCN